MGFNLNVYRVCIAGYPLHRENGNKKSLSGKTQEIFGTYPKKKNQGIWFAQVVKFPDSKGKRYFDILKLDKSAKSILCI